MRKSWNAHYLLLVGFGVLALSAVNFLTWVPISLAEEILTVRTLTKGKVSISGFQFC